MTDPTMNTVYNTLLQARRRRYRVPRWIQRARAYFGGYFWLPCPVCGRKFGGHERPRGDLYRGGETPIGKVRHGSIYCAASVAKYGRQLVLSETLYDMRESFDIPLEVLLSPTELEQMRPDNPTNPKGTSLS